MLPYDTGRAACAKGTPRDSDSIALRISRGRAFRCAGFPVRPRAQHAQTRPLTVVFLSPLRRLEMGDIYVFASCVILDIEVRSEPLVVPEFKGRHLDYPVLVLLSLSGHTDLMCHSAASAQATTARHRFRSPHRSRPRAHAPLAPPRAQRARGSARPSPDVQEWRIVEHDAASTRCGGCNFGASCLLTRQPADCTVSLAHNYVRSI